MIEILSNIFKSIAPKIINQYINDRFGKHIFIDRLVISKIDDLVLFDITTSSNSDQDIGIYKLTALFLDKQHGPINGPIEISSQYQNKRSEDFEIQKSNNALIAKFDVLEKQNSKSTNRFIYKWLTNEEIYQYRMVESFITYSIRGKLKNTNKIIQENPLFRERKIYGPPHG